MKRAILYIHGKGGSCTEAEQYRKNCKGFELTGVDYDGDFHGLHRIKFSGHMTARARNLTVYGYLQTALGLILRCIRCRIVTLSGH